MCVHVCVWRCTVQVGLQARYTRGTGQVVLFLGNKSRDAMLSNLRLTPGPLPPGLQVSVAPGPPALAPGQQVQVAIQVSLADSALLLSTLCKL